VLPSWYRRRLGRSAAQAARLLAFCLLGFLP
jgi:hypothetical protein